MASEISNLNLVKDKDVYASDDSITINVKFSLSGDVRNSFNEKNWTDAYENNDNQFKLKYGIKLISSGLRKHDVVKQIDTYRKASIFWTRNPKLVNPMKEKRIWVQVAKNFEPIIKLTEEEVQKELFDFDESFILNALDLGQGKHKVSAEVFASWNKHTYIEKNEVKNCDKRFSLFTSNMSANSIWGIIRSIPIPIPDVGGIPYSRDLMKSLSINIASSSPLLLSSSCFSNLLN